MLQQKLKQEITEFDKKWHKLIFLCGINEPIQYENVCKLNINLIVSDGLMHISKRNYPTEVESVIRERLHSEDVLYEFNHIDILFSQELKVDPVRLLENLSKSYKIIVNWPGRFEQETLYYAEHGHSEYYMCRNYSGVVIEN